MAYLNTMVLRGAAPRRRAKKHAAPRVGLKCPACFVVGFRRLIIKSRLDPPPRIRDISDPSQSQPLLGQAPGLLSVSGAAVALLSSFFYWMPCWAGFIGLLLSFAASEAGFLTSVSASRPDTKGMDLPVLRNSRGGE